MTVFARSLDVDDPSNETEFVDPNDTGTAGGYSGSAATYTAENDNRATDENGTFTGEENGLVALSFTTEDQEVEAEFEVSMHPGDNYAVAVNADPDFLRQLRNLDQFDGQRIVDPSIGGEPDERRVAAHCCSRILTVWRLLHLEVDRMGPPLVNGGEANHVEGHVSGFKRGLFPATPELVPTTAFTVEDIPDGDPSRHLTMVGNEGNGRFEQGTIRIGRTAPPAPDDVYWDGVFHALGNYAYAPSFFPLDGNGATRVARDAGIYVRCAIQKPGVEQCVARIHYSEDEDVWITRIDDEGNGVLRSDHVGGTISVNGHTPMTITAVDLFDQRVTVEEWFDIPFVLVDDDADAFDLDDVSPELTALAELESAYILYVEDGGGNPANSGAVFPFVRNMTRLEAEDIVDSRQSAGNASDEYWTAYVVVGWQADAFRDKDPDSEAWRLGGAYSAEGDAVHSLEIRDGFKGAVVFEECRREVGPESRHVVLHEVGHQFGLGHGDDKSPGGEVPEYPNVGIMHNTLEAGTHFTPRHVNLIRTRKASPGGNE